MDFVANGLVALRTIKPRWYAIIEPTYRFSSLVHIVKRTSLGDTLVNFLYFLFIAEI